MLGRVLQTIERHAMFAPGMRLGLAVSGGADSMFLLHLLHELAPRWNLRLSVVHIDHGIRGEASRADAEFVRRAAAAFALPFYLREAEVADMDDNLEQAARLVRQEFFRELVGVKLDRIATGHTRSDQAETVLYRLLRGAGLAGLSGILPVTEPGVVRPLLDLERVEIENWLRERRIEWREDETNQHLSYARNRLRHEVLPVLRQAFNPRVDEALANLATLSQDEEDYWASQIPPVEAAPGPVAVYRVADLASSHPAVARRRVRRAIESVKGNLRQVDFAHVETLLEMARSERGSGRVQLPGLDIFRSFEWIRIAPAGFDSGRAREFSFPVQVPGSVAIPDGSGTVNFELTGEAGAGDCLDFHLISGPLELRNWSPGDQYHRAGATEPQKIKFLFQEARIPLWERRNWPVLVCDGRIIWVRRFGPASGMLPSRETRQVLHIWESA